MNNEIIEHRSWLSKYWKWLTLIIGLGITIIVLISSSELGSNISDITRAYTDSSVCSKALTKVKENNKIIELLGDLEPIGNLAILEGSVQYSNNYNSLNLTVDIRGAKSKNKIRTKMDVSAVRDGDNWIYKKINVRIKKPADLKQTIEVYKSPE